LKHPQEREVVQARNRTEALALLDDRIAALLSQGRGVGLLGGRANCVKRRVRRRGWRIRIVSEARIYHWGNA
jgi:hypothetical protein